jgi:hypothetical protein
MLLNLSQIGPIAAPQPVLVLALMSGFAIDGAIKVAGC